MTARRRRRRRNQNANVPRRHAGGAHEIRELYGRRQVKLRRGRRRRRHRRTASHRRKDRELARSARRRTRIDDIRRLTAGRAPDRACPGLQFLPVVPDPQRIVCVGINYRSHAAETGRDISPAPSVFLRLADTLLGHGQALVRPRVSDAVRLRGRTRRRHRAAGAPRVRSGRARPRRRIHLLRRRQRARLPEILRHLRQEFSRHRSARPRHGDGGRNRRSHAIDPRDASERRGDAALRAPIS